DNAPIQTALRVTGMIRRDAATSNKENTTAIRCLECVIIQRVYMCATFLSICSLLFAARRAVKVFRRLVVTVRNCHTGMLPFANRSTNYVGRLEKYLSHS